MSRRFFALVVALPLLAVGCKKASHPLQNDAGLKPATPGARVAIAPSPASSATPRTKPAIDRNARVIVLSYHRFEDRSRNALTIATADFKAQMQALKDQGIAVISMKDFLEWRRQENHVVWRRDTAPMPDAASPAKPGCRALQKPAPKAPH